MHIGKVNGIHCLTGMQFAGFTVLILTIVIENTISYVRSLLNFRNECSGANAMYTTGRDVKHISRLYGASLKHFGKCSVVHPVFIFLRSYLLGKAGNQFCTFIGSNDIPHFIFTETVMAFLCKFVTRMHLNGQIQLCINKLYQ